jgi:carboxyl-terminal processing protease
MKLLKPVAFLFTLFLLFSLGFFARDVLAGQSPDLQAFQRLTQTEAAESSTPVETFETHFRNILAKHGESTTKEKLRYAAMTGLVASLGDPHTNFLEPKVNERFSTETSGNYSGIGARLQQDPLGAKIATVFKTGPAFSAGIQVGDIVTEVDEKPVAGKDVDQIVERILGDAGTPVKLGLIRTGHTGLKELIIIRQKVIIPTVEEKIVSGDIGYINVSGFSEPTPRQFETAVLEYDRMNPAGLIIDLRGNPGGLLNAAVEMLSLFVDEKPAVTINARGATDQSSSNPLSPSNSVTLKTLTGRAISNKYPIVILINEESASASEIFSGVMRDYKKATLIGDHTYGKASVQELHPLPEGASAKITIAKYLLPATGDISRRVDEDGGYLSGGLAPDIRVEIPRDGEFQLAIPGNDPQLDRAIQFIRQNRMN